MHARTSTIRALFAGAALSLVAAPAGAQAFAYPSFQTPRVAQREFNFGFADADAFDATSLLFQWREGSGSRNQLSLDVGFADTNSDGLFFLGGQFGRQLTTSNASMPFDVLFTAGANIAHLGGNNSFTVLRIPVGVSAGHVFRLDGGTTLTPFIHPRLVFANCGNCGGDDTNLGLEFDLGGELKFSPAFGVRLSASFGDSDVFNGDSFGVSLAWTPGRMARAQR